MPFGGLHAAIVMSGAQSKGYFSLKCAVEYAKEHGVLDRRQGDTGCTPLMLSCRLGNVAAVKLLVKAGASRACTPS